MPTPDDIDRLKKLAGEEGLDEDEQPTISADGKKVHVSVNLHQHGRSRSEPTKNGHHPLKALLEIPWVKAALVLLLGAGGSEGHRIIAAVGFVQRSDLEAHKKEVALDLGGYVAKLEAAKRYEAETRELCSANSRELYGVGRYLYYVLPKTGVLVTLEPEVPIPPLLEFHPAPLRNAVTPKDSKPIQPKETFPMPERP